jgi:uncharacterized RDD family membrane protein YckC
MDEEILPVFLLDMAFANFSIFLDFWVDLVIGYVWNYQKKKEGISKIICGVLFWEIGP